MAKTFTEQSNLPPSGTSWTRDGEGMHSAIPFDGVRGMNNLGTYVNNHLHYVQGSSSSSAAADGNILSPVAGAPEERFMLEIPLYVPLWGDRLVWVAGAKAQTSTLTAVSVYVAADPYTGFRDDAFDATNLTAGYVSHSVSMALTVGTYGLADDSATGVTGVLQVARDINAGIGLHTKKLAYAIMTANGGTSSSVVQIYDASFWFLPS